MIFLEYFHITLSVQYFPNVSYINFYLLATVFTNCVLYNYVLHRGRSYYWHSKSLQVSWYPPSDGK